MIHKQTSSETLSLVFVPNQYMIDLDHAFPGQNLMVDLICFGKAQAWINNFVNGWHCHPADVYTIF